MNVVVPFHGDGVGQQAQRINFRMQKIRPMYLLTLDDLEYGRIFRQLWEAGEPFINVEHDVLPWPGALQEMWDCEEPFCAFPYDMGESIHTAMGCTKFTPDGPCPLPDEYGGDWNGLWHELEIVFRNLPPVHEHGPPVIHVSERRAGNVRMEL